MAVTSARSDSAYRLPEPLRRFAPVLRWCDRPVGRHSGNYLVLLLILVVPTMLANEYWLTVLAQAGIYILVTNGINLVLGYGGQVAIGQSALFAVGAYATALLTIDGHWDFWYAVLVAIVLGALCGIALGTPSLRLPAWSFAVITLGVAQVAYNLASYFDFTGGYSGLIGVPRPTIAGHILDTPQFYLLIVVVNLAVFLMLRNLCRARFGRALLVARHEITTAQANGVGPVTVRTLAFTFAGAVAGLAGALFAGQASVVTPDDFPVLMSIYFVVAVVLGGGMGSLWAGVVGGGIFYVVPTLLNDFTTYRLIVYGVILVVVLIFAPNGVCGMLRRLWVRLLKVTAPPSAARDGVEARSPGEPRSAVVEHLVNSTSAEQRERGPVVECRDVTMAFGGVRALQDVSWACPRGTVQGIVGPNGSGKTTLLNALCGFYRPQQGEITIDGHAIVGARPQRIARFGVGRTFQTPQLVNGLSVLDNVLVGSFYTERSTWIEILLDLPRARRERRELAVTAKAMLDGVGVPRSAWQSSGGEVPHATRRLVELARALMASPQVLLLDEPAAGLSDHEMADFARLISSLREAGLTVVVVEHHMDFVRELCDELTVFDHGTIIAQGLPHEVLSSQKVNAIYVGTSWTEGVVP